MGDINFDLTKSKAFLAVPYACAAIGAWYGVATTAATTLPGLIGVGAIGAVAGGIGLPIAVTVAAVGVYGLYAAGKELFKVLKKEGALIPLGAAVVGMNCAKALTVVPVQAAYAGLKKLLSLRHCFNSKAAKPSDPPAPESAKPTPPTPPAPQ